MNVRVTGQTQVASAIAYMRQQTAAGAKYQDQIASGLRIKAASDGPVEFAELGRARAAGQRYDAYLQTMADATTDLNAGVASLQDVNQLLVRAAQIAQEGVNATSDPNGYEALATEVDGLLERLLSAANTNADGRYLFGGTATGTPPFRVTGTDAQGRPTGVAYQGAFDRTQALVGPGQTVETRYVGEHVFQQPGGDAFQALIGLRDTLRDATPGTSGKAQALGQRLAAVQTVRDRIGEVIGEQSAHLASLESFTTRVKELRLGSQTRAGELESTDYPAAILSWQQQEAALQATMAVSARLLQPSLLDFLR